jgi:hypothetical protein
MPDDFRSQDAGAVVAAPLEALITGVGRAVAEAQRLMDEETTRSVIAVGLGSDAQLERMRRLGYQPTWYRIPEADAELVVALTLHGEQSESGGSARLFAAPADAHFTNRYAYDLRAASTVRFKVVAVPAPPPAERQVIVPALLNRLLSEAEAILNERGIPYRVEGTPPPTGKARVRRTEPKAGELIGLTTPVILFVGRG